MKARELSVSPGPSHFGGFPLMHTRCWGGAVTGSPQWTPPTLLGGLRGSRKWSCARVRASGEVWETMLGVYFPAWEEHCVVPPRPRTPAVPHPAGLTVLWPHQGRGPA